MVDTTTTADHMAGGCVIASCAMVLRNMNKTTIATKSDFRTGYAGRLYADPYTVMLGNIGSTGNVVNNGTYYSLPNAPADPVYAYGSTIGSAFGATYNSQTLPGTTSGNVAAIANALQSHPQGVIVRFAGKHDIVITQDRGSSYGDTGRFIVCDPAGNAPSKGRNVPFSSSYTGSKYTLAQATLLRTFS